MKFTKRERTILIPICLLCIIAIPLVFFRVLPFITLPLVILISSVIIIYISVKWIKWKNTVQK